MAACSKHNIGLQSNRGHIPASTAEGIGRKINDLNHSTCQTSVAVHQLVRHPVLFLLDDLPKMLKSTIRLRQPYT
jgi:hypothetical protein